MGVRGPQVSETKNDGTDDAMRNTQPPNRLGGRVKRLRIRHGVGTDDLIAGMNILWIQLEQDHTVQCRITI